VSAAWRAGAARSTAVAAVPCRGGRTLRPRAVFLYVIPAAQSRRESEEGSALTPRSAKSRSASSGMVMSCTASTTAIRKARCGPSPLGLGGRGRRSAVVVPSRSARLTQRMAEVALTPNRSATARRDQPRHTKPEIPRIRHGSPPAMVNHTSHPKQNPPTIHLSGTRL
jgi:hypothetical protein